MNDTHDYCLIYIMVSAIAFLSLGCDHSTTEKQATDLDNPQQETSTTKETDMPGKIAVEEKWDFYQCRVEDRPASMSLNMAYAHHAPISSAGYVYWLDFKIADPGEHGMGTGDCVDDLYELEDSVVQQLADTEFYYVGRLRNRGYWEMYFFGPDGLKATLDAAAAKACQDIAAVPYEYGSKPDPQWAIYTDFIYPKPAERRWMSDRSVVDVLAEHGDQHDMPRRIDHWLYFESKADRDAAVSACKAEGFSVETRSDDNDGHLSFGLQIYREDPSRLEHIYSVTSMLNDMAASHNGEYDGWETFIVRDNDKK